VLRITTLAFCACMLLACPAAPAMAQSSTSFPPQLVATPNPSQAQRDQIQSVADENMRMLESGDPAQMRQAREDLRVALRDPQASAAFRNAVSDHIGQRLAAMARGGDEKVAVTALQLSGHIATDSTIDLLEGMLADQRETMRYVAAFGFDSAFRTLRGGSPALTDRRVRTMVDRLAERIRREQQPVVLDMNVRALISAMRIGFEVNDPALRDHAMLSLVGACGERVQKLQPADRPALAPMLKAAQAVRNELQALRINPPLPRDTVREAGGFCGDLIAFVFRSVRAGALPIAPPGANDAQRAEVAAERSVCTTALALAQSTIPLAKDKLNAGGPDDPVPQDLDELIRRATRQGDEQFLQRALDIIGDGGILTSDGFNFNANRFLK